MIRGNYSLAREVRKTELRLRLRLQQKQKDAHLTEKLRAADPARLFFRIQRLEGDPKSATQLKKLRSEWAFMVKHGIHKEKVEQLEAQQKEKKLQAEKARTKLWGKQSVYFNPELNPLGKVPPGYPNTTKPVKFVKPTPDAKIGELGIELPVGDPPRFYKNVQNTAVQTLTAQMTEEMTEQPSKQEFNQTYKRRRVGKQ